jgi:O-antigen ligase
LSWLSLLALLYRALRKWVPQKSDASEWLRALFNFVEDRGWLYLFGAVVIASALLTSHSRGGLASTMVGTVIFWFSLNLNGLHQRGPARRFGFMVLVLLSLAAIAGGSVVGDRFSKANAHEDDRLRVFSLTAEAIKERPLLGTGVGTYEETFRLFRTPDLLWTFAQAHNSYLETALELGIPAICLIVASILLISLFNLMGARQRSRDFEFACLGMAATGLVGCHALMDFSIQIPAVAIVYAALLGVSLAQSWSSQARAGW